MPWSPSPTTARRWMRVRAPVGALALRGARRDRPRRRPGHWCARRPAARTSASAGAAARRRSRSWATPARAPAATAPSCRASTATRSTRSSRARWRRPRRAWASATSVVTSVDRDDLPDAGAAALGRHRAGAPPPAPRRGASRYSHRTSWGCEEEALVTVLEAGPRRLQPQHRDLPPHPAARCASRATTTAPSGSCGAPARCGTERWPERGAAADHEVRDRRRHGRDRRRDHRDDARPPARTTSTWSPIGQYLQPSARHLPLDRWVPLERSAASATRAWRWASARSSRDRSCARSYRADEQQQAAAGREPAVAL